MEDRVGEKIDSHSQGTTIQNKAVRCIAAARHDQPTADVSNHRKSTRCPDYSFLEHAIRLSQIRQSMAYGSETRIKQW